mgnify:CR=1 FL=1
MKIPSKDTERFNFYIDLKDKCFVTRNDRRKTYLTQRSFFMFGASSESSGKIINKIYPHIDQLAGLMYSSETTRFSIDLPPSVSDMMKEKIPPLSRKLNDTWHLSNADLVFGQALLWSFVYGSMFIKLRVGLGGQIEPYVVEPHDIGVLREDVCGLWKQEAFTHAYWITESSLETQLREIEHPRIEGILKALHPKTKENAPETQQVLSRIDTSASMPNMIGNINFDIETPSKYKPRVAEKLVQMCELYVWDDEEYDYQVVTMAEPGVIIFDRPLRKMFLKNEAPMIQMPPKFGSGFQSDVGEVQDAMDSPNGLVIGDMPGAKLETVSPQIPDDLFREIREIDMMFEDMSGITNVIQGKGEAGVRSQGHAANLARLGSSRAKKRALIIEDQLEKLATLYLQLMQAYDPDRMRDDKGEQFIAEQFTKDFIVKVDAHSNSPIFQEDQRALAFELFKAKAIDRESLLDLLDMPMKELLKSRLKTRIEPQEAAAAQQQQAMAMAGGKVTKLKGK